MALSDLFSKSSNKKQMFTASAAAVLTAAVVTGAVVYPGFTTADVDLNDGSVWVTNRADGMVGHLNDQSKVLDGGFSATTTEFDVIQNGNNVFMDGDGGSLLNPVSVPLMAMAAETSLGGGKEAAQGTRIVALSDSGAGKVWAMDNAAVPGFNDKTSEPILSGLGSAVSAVAPDDTIYTVDGKAGELITTVVDGTGKAASQERVKLEGLAGTADPRLTVAGGKPVVLDPETGRLFLPGGKSATLPEAKGALLAQPTAEGDFVALESATALFTQPLDGSAAKVLQLGSTGRAAAPVVQDGCVHAAWSGANKYALACNGTGGLVDIPKAAANSEFVFRKNRDVVVLNDVNSGNVWLVNQNMLLVNNWDDLKTDLKNADNADKDSADPNVVSTLPDRTKPNRPPEAAPDSFGVRAGRTTILPVLFNDSDPDGDVLTVEPPAVEPAFGAVASIYDGTGLQIAVPEGQAGAGNFQYTANDGRSGTAKGSVDVRVVPESENTKPRTMRETTFVVELGQVMKQNVLTDWIDPDGDDIFLNSAVSDDGSAIIKTSPDGELSYADDGENVGMKTMTITVSDGREITEKKLKVNVKPSGGVPPVANADFVRAVAGQPVVLAPLKNDQDPAGGKLRLASVSKPANATVSEIADNGTVTFSSDTVGDVYLEYQVTNGPMSATGLIRVKVSEADKAGLPVAVKDLVMLPSGGSALVDVLGNDSDPAGGVLVIQSVDLPVGSPVSATIIDRNIIKLTDLRGLKDKMGIKYTISNGAGNATGEISVVRIPAPDKLLPPRVEPDTAIVRVGDVVTIPVLENDTDPNGEVLKSPVVVEAPDAAFGKLFTDQNQLRFIAGPTPKKVQGVYKVANSTGQFNSAPISITIVAADPERNLPPAPKNLTGRVIAGDMVRIPVPLNAIDPEGDSVQLVGIDKGPALGTAETGNGYIFYTAGGSSAGTDSFTYRVRDRLGAEAVARVDVGIAPPLAVNHPPVTEDDYITMRPGRKVALDVLLNDSDPDGGLLGLVKDGFDGPEEMLPSVTDKGKVLVTSPMEPGIATMLYTVADKFGARATGNIRMTVTPDAPLKAPIARDDRVTVKQMLGKNTVDVPVLENDADPDGVTEELKLSIEAVNGTKTDNASVTGNGAVRVVLAPQDQMIPYTVTDQDGLKSTAVIWVPGLDKQYPVLKSNEVIRLTAGESAVMKLADYVQVREGRKPRLTEASKISLVGAGRDKVIVGDGEGVNYAATITFYGPGSITFEVTDGSGPDDPNGLKSTLTVMTLVDPAPAGSKPKKDGEKKPEEKKNTPPTFTGSSLDVPQQESVTLDVGPLAFDIDPGDKDKFKYALAGDRPANFDVDFSGTVLKVRQKDGTKVGESATVQLTVTDGSNAPVTADVVLRATSSSLPLPVANEDIVLDAHAGRAEVVDVLKNDVNPYPDTQLRVVDTMTETGSAGVSVSHTDGAVTVNSEPDYKGTVVVRYVVQDKTKDEARNATGRIKITIKGHPDAPAKPQVMEEKDQAVLLTWDPPADNGSPITKYTVAWAGGTQDCDTNTCTITGLTNATTYKFKVTATNAVGASPASPESVEATPDTMPDAPAAPTTEYGDKSVTVRWVTPVGKFSAVTKFNVEISPAPAGQNAQKADYVGNSVTWTGLDNGTEYQFRVQAINNAPDPSEWSPYSASVVPAGLPSAPNAPTVQLLDSVGNQNQISVQWNEPYNNGAAITSYTLTQSGGGAATQAIPVSGTSHTVTVGTSTSPYTYSVTATNKAGEGAASPNSAPQRAVGKVGTMAAPGISIQDQNGAGGSVAVTYQPLSAAQLNGYAANEVTYCVKLSTTGERCGVGSGVKLPSPNGANVYATVYARASAGAAGSVGDASGASATVSPYGIPLQNSVSGSRSGQGDKTVRWTWSAANNNGSAITRYESSLNGAGWEGRGMNMSYSTGTAGFGDAANLRVRACNAGGCGPASAPATSWAGSAPPPPDPPATYVRVEAGTWHSCTMGPNGGGVFQSNPARCDGAVSPGGNVNLGGNWLDYADGWIKVSGCRSNWYVMADGPVAGRWVRSDTVDVRDEHGGNIRC
ncbi:Ig-like domain-containing protein [Arthrobacter sp. HY1533]|uniref:Ig-like domain-containing protein n=1 Tax=Arthrobacter sp. HY1533 TaxID=2970919 RepID=UPI0022BA0D06|nr:Ig-like domain-containing protein [Arthrobacter sp. HY1533]